jgi:hypothetical protein
MPQLASAITSGTAVTKEPLINPNWTDYGMDGMDSISSSHATNLLLYQYSRRRAFATRRKRALGFRDVGCACRDPPQSENGLARSKPQSGSTEGSLILIIVA